MATYFFVLIGLTSLCACWAIFQLWLARQDADLAERSNQCGGCNGRCKK